MQGQATSSYPPRIASSRPASAAANTVQSSTPSPPNSYPSRRESQRGARPVISGAAPQPRSTPTPSSAPLINSAASLPAYQAGTTTAQQQQQQQQQLQQQPPPPAYSTLPPGPPAGPPLPQGAAYPQAVPRSGPTPSFGAPRTRDMGPTTVPKTDDVGRSNACGSCMWFYDCSALGECCGWCCIGILQCFCGA